MAGPVNSNITPLFYFSWGGSSPLAFYHRSPPFRAERTSLALFFLEDGAMPAKSKRQLAAMGAACGGKSTLGIPKEVGCEMVKATKRVPKVGRVSRKGKK